MQNLDQILIAHKTIQTQMQPLLASLKDTTIPLDERWEAFTQLVDNHILVNTTSGDGWINLLGPNMTMYDDFHTDRYASITFTDMYDIIIDPDSEFGGDGFDIANLTLWQERVLASGCSEVTYDW